jgi:hypothetical protein
VARNAVTPIHHLVALCSPVGPRVAVHSGNGVGIEVAGEDDHRLRVVATDDGDVLEIDEDQDYGATSRWPSSVARPGGRWGHREPDTGGAQNDRARARSGRGRRLGGRAHRGALDGRDAAAGRHTRIGDRWPRRHPAPLGPVPV